jgi:hypothetical protein
LRGLLPGSPVERDASALDNSLALDLSPDGGSLLIQEQGESAPANYAVYLRHTQASSPPVLLGEGSPLSISPDGQRILLLMPSDRQRLLLLPSGAGDIRHLSQTGLEYQGWGSFLPDGHRFLCLANERAKALRLYLQDVEKGLIRAITPEGVNVAFGTQPVSTDGKFVVAIGPDGKPTVYPVEGGEPRTIPGTEPGDVPTRISSDGRSVFVYERGKLPARVFRIHLTTGQRSLWREIMPNDPAGLGHGISRFLPTPDGRFYVYTAPRNLSDLYLVEGLK